MIVTRLCSNHGHNPRLSELQYSLTNYPQFTCIQCSHTMGQKTHTDASYILLKTVQFLVHRAAVKALDGSLYLRQRQTARLWRNRNILVDLSYIPRPATNVLRVMLIMLSTWLSFESSHGSSDEFRTTPSGCWFSLLTNRLSRRVHLYSPLLSTSTPTVAI